MTAPQYPADEVHSRRLITEDGQAIHATVYPAVKAKGTVIMASALGVPQSYYSRYATFLMGNGYQCICFDYRGTANSPFAGDLDDIELIDWGKQDLHRVIEEAKTLAQEQSLSPDNIILVGHSIGGQITGMTSEIKHIKRALFVASSAPYWRRWTGLGKLSMFLNVYLMVPAACFGRKVFPAKAVGFSSMNMPASVAKTWASWMRTPNYLFDRRHGYDISGYQDLNFPIMSLGFSDDNFAPKTNIDRLLSFFPNCKIDDRQVDAKAHGGIGHMGYFHNKHQHTLWKEGLEWIEAKPLS